MDTVDIDSLKLEYEQTSDIQRKVELCIDIGKALLQQGQYEESRKYSFTGLSLIKGEIDNSSYDLNSILGVGYMHQNDYEQAKIYLQSAMSVAEQMDNTYQLACGANNLGCLAYSVNDYKDALSYFSRSEELSEFHGYFANLWSTYLNTMRIYIDLHKYDEALKYFNKIVSSCKDDHYLAQAYIAIGKLYFTIKNLKLANYYTNLALKYYNETDEKYFIVGCFLQLADICLARKKYDKAFEYGSRALALCQECHFDTYLFEALMCLTLVYLRQKEYTKVDEYIEQLLSREAVVEDFIDRLSFYRIITRYYTEIGDEIKAEEYLKKYEYLKKEYLESGGDERYLFNDY